MAEKPFDTAKFFAIMGPCVIENPEITLGIAESLAETGQRLGLQIIFKASFDKANRTSIESFRGPGMEKGLEILAKVRRETGLPVISDIHQPDQAKICAEVLDVIQIPAFLCRQTDLLLAAGKTGKVVNLKKGQFVAPWDMQAAVGKLKGAGCQNIWLTERGSSFGYNNLVVDMRSIPAMASLGCPVIMDATHSVQLPGGLGSSSGGDRTLAPVLAKAAVAAGANGVFMEVHPRPDEALCDGPNSLELNKVEPLLKTLSAIHNLVRAEE
ncbi:2-dehydro-3-deoxyphosphooctonate aldolase [Dethiosulfatarculus sandiegensis]|uniref:2-dehydro-3-deoxyphosphooctonate aldolase n=1 Tax=Dethiosulfatarculus sandiegensis TaxID=1429043 RepID=A0A0D2HS50_9BACT|nr:2-dehydro-3-deoxyphosphooctonate aldolase [Dethiosulfatarculus sandiegensis]